MLFPADHGAGAKFIQRPEAQARQRAFAALNSVWSLNSVIGSFATVGHSNLPPPCFPAVWRKDSSRPAKQRLGDSHIRAAAIGGLRGGRR